ncbi:MAG: pyridoxamine 5'-phosphate oxidase family protein [Bacteroidota bacterium]
MQEFPKTERNKVKRLPKRGHYDQKTIYKILDDHFLCHVGFVVDGQPFVIPTSYGREDNKLYLHGSSKSRMLMNAEKGIPICVTVTHLDGLVLARSSFNHSMNYRSVVVYGKARKLEGEEKEKALFVISENILKGRWDEARVPTEKELKATTVLSVEIDSASAKIRSGPPGDDKPDYELDVWAGVIPIKHIMEPPIPDPVLRDGIPVPESVKNVYEK